MVGPRPVRGRLMAINQVQFQQGLSMPEFMARYGTEAKCRRVLYQARWPDGFCCAGCAGRRASQFRREGQVYWQCRACRGQTTLLTGTLFAASQQIGKWCGRGQGCQDVLVPVVAVTI